MSLKPQTCALNHRLAKTSIDILMTRFHSSWIAEKKETSTLICLCWRSTAYYSGQMDPCAEYSFGARDQSVPLKGILFKYCRIFTLLFDLGLFCSILWEAFGKGRIQGSSSYRYSTKLEFLSLLRDGRTLGFCCRITAFLGICQSGM